MKQKAILLHNQSSFSKAINLIQKCCLVSLAVLLLLINIDTNAMAATPKTDLIQNSRVVFFGDSLTAYGTWVEDIKEQFNLAAAINSGVGGNTSTNGLARFDSAVKRHNPDFVIINFCMNDHVTDLPDFPKTTKKHYKSNLEVIVDKVRDIGAIPVFYTTSYMIEEMYYTRHPKENYVEAGGAQQLLDDYIEIMRQVAASKGVDLVDVRAECDRYKQEQILASDGVHLSDLGNQLYAKVIGNFLKAKFSQTPVIKTVTVKFIDKKTGDLLLPTITYEGAAGARIRLVAKQIQNYKLKNSNVTDFIFKAPKHQEYVFRYNKIEEAGNSSTLSSAIKSSASPSSVIAPSQQSTATSSHNNISSSVSSAEVSINDYSSISKASVSTVISSLGQSDNILPEKPNKPIIYILSFAGILAISVLGFAVYHKFRK